MKFFEFIYYDENNCAWNFENVCGNNVVIEADNCKEAEAKLIASVDSYYEEESRKYYAREIEDIEEYGICKSYTIW